MDPAADRQFQTPPGRSEPGERREAAQPLDIKLPEAVFFGEKMLSSILLRQSSDPERAELEKRLDVIRSTVGDDGVYQYDQFTKKEFFEIEARLTANWKQQLEYLAGYFIDSYYESQENIYRLPSEHREFVRAFSEALATQEIDEITRPRLTQGNIEKLLAIAREADRFDDVARYKGEPRMYTSTTASLLIDAYCREYLLPQDEKRLLKITKNSQSIVEYHKKVIAPLLESDVEFRKALPGNTKMLVDHFNSMVKDFLEDYIQGEVITREEMRNAAIHCKCYRDLIDELPSDQKMRIAEQIQRNEQQAEEEAKSIHPPEFISPPERQTVAQELKSETPDQPEIEQAIGWLEANVGPYYRLTDLTKDELMGLHEYTRQVTNAGDVVALLEDRLRRMMQFSGRIEGRAPGGSAIIASVLEAFDQAIASNQPVKHVNEQQLDNVARVMMRYMPLQKINQPFRKTGRRIAEPDITHMVILAETYLSDVIEAERAAAEDPIYMQTIEACLEYHDEVVFMALETDEIRQIPFGNEFDTLMSIDAGYQRYGKLTARQRQFLPILFEKYHNALQNAPDDIKRKLHDQEEINKG